nr:MAP/microtubule affinity-regulating kinase 3-like [Equus asinus]
MTTDLIALQLCHAARDGGGRQDHTEEGAERAATAKRLLCETQGLARLRHPHILRLVEVIESEETLFIISEYVRGGNLLDHLMKHGPLTEEEARGWFRQLVSALQYCHRRGVIHRDLKPENVLLDPAGSAKLADFGFCSLDPGGPLSTFCGTPGYMAPEVMRLQPYAGPPADVWSLGVLLHAMLAGSLPFWGEDFDAIQRSTLRGSYSPPRLGVVPVRPAAQRPADPRPWEEEDFGGGDGGPVGQLGPAEAEALQGAAC